MIPIVEVATAALALALALLVPIGAVVFLVGVIVAFVVHVTGWQDQSVPLLLRVAGVALVLMVLGPDLAERTRAFAAASMARLPEVGRGAVK